LGDKQAFINDLSDVSKIHKLYLALIKEGYNERQLGTEDQFIYYLSK